MAVDIKGYRVFIASPRGLENERQKFFDTIQEYNRVEALPVNIQFVPVGWEYTLPGMGRPQSIINEEVKTCDYFVLVLWDRWGTPPDKNGKGKYSSGTEEEYHVALDGVGDKGYPMRQIVALFKAVDERRLNDPGPELQKVLDFKKRLEEEKTILFKTFEGPDDFEKILRAILAQWRRDGEQGQTAKVRKPEFPPCPQPSGIPTKPEKELKALTEQTRNMVEEAQKSADEGKITEAEELFAKAVVNSGEPYAYTVYGRFLARVGRLGQARVMLEQALDISTKMGDEKGVAASYGNLGLIYQKRGELDEAEQMHKKALEINERIGWLEGMAGNYGNLGLIYQTRGELDKAEQMLKKSLEIHEKLGRLEGMASNYGNLGLIYQTRGELDKAEETLKRALEINERIGWLEGMANQYGNLGLVYLTQGDLDKAEQMLKKSLEISERIGWLEGMAGNYGNLGFIYKTRGELDKAEQMLKRALEINEKIGRLGGMASDYGNLGVIYQTRGELDKAEEMYKKSLEIEERIGRLGGIADDYANLGSVYKQRGDYKRAREYWEKARDLYKKIGMPNMVKKVEEWIEEIDKPRH